MSTEDIAENTDELFATLTEAVAVAHEPSVTADSEDETKPRAPPIADDPPRGASRSLGGTCPECGGPMVTRLRAVYDHESARPMVELRVTGICDSCDHWLEGTTPQIRLSEREV